MKDGDQPSRWTERRVKIIDHMLRTPWIGQTNGAEAIGRSRGTVHNLMRDGEVRSIRVGGSKFRSAYTADLLVFVLADINVDQELGADMGHCSSAVIDAVRRSVTANERYKDRDASGSGPIDLAHATRRAFIYAKRAGRTSERTVREPANERTNERETS